MNFPEEREGNKKGMKKVYQAVDFEVKRGPAKGKKSAILNADSSRDDVSEVLQNKRFTGRKHARRNLFWSRVGFF